MFMCTFGIMNIKDIKKQFLGQKQNEFVEALN